MRMVERLQLKQAGWIGVVKLADTNKRNFPPLMSADPILFSYCNL
jgi:hypothetical protein